MRLILASASPRRQTLLRDAGYQFLVSPADVDEDDYLNKLAPRELAVFLARAKAQEVSRRFPKDVTLAADTVVAFGDTPLGKAEDPSQAAAMLELLSGTTHIVITGVAVYSPSNNLQRVDAAMSAVRMRHLRKADIEEYLATNLWKGKAGAYGIQDKDPLVTCIAGSQTNVIGLPMDLTEAMLAEAGVKPAK